MEAEVMEQEVDVSNMSYEEIEQMEEPQAEETQTPVEETAQAEDGAQAQAEVQTEAPESTQQSALEQELAAIKKQNEGVQQLLSRWGTEIGSLRQLVNQPKQQPQDDSQSEEEYLNRFTEKPLTAVQQTIQQELERRKLEDENLAYTILQNRLALTQEVPDIDSMAEDIAKAYEEDSGDPLGAQKLRTNMYGFQKPQIVSYAKRVQLARENQKLRQEIEKLRNSSEEKLNKIAAVSKRSGSINGRSGQSSVGMSAVTEADLDKMTAAELDEFIKNNTE